MDKSAEGDAGNWEQPWPCGETLRTLAELNEQCLELLVEQATEHAPGRAVTHVPGQAMTHAPGAPPMFRDLVDLWSGLDTASRRRAAACPFLLVDAGFADPYRWRWVGGGIRVGDREPAGSPAFLSAPAFFTAPSALKVAHQVFTNAWYMVRTQPLGSALYLGMPTHCAGWLRTCTVRQVTELGNQHAGWLRPRWFGRVRIWRELLVAAISGEEPALERARLHGVQLLAMELKALEQVSAREPRQNVR